MNGKTQVLNGVFEKTRAEIVNPAGKFAIFSSKRFAIRNFRDSKAVYKEVNRMKTPVRCMDCELDSHLFWTKRSHTRWIRQYGSSIGDDINDVFDRIFSKEEKAELDLVVQLMEEVIKTRKSTTFRTSLKAWT